jgi:hypothetical protein
VHKRNSKTEIQRTKSKVHGKFQQTSRTRRKAKIKANYITKAKTAKQTKGKKNSSYQKHQHSITYPSTTPVPQSTHNTDKVTISFFPTTISM